MTPEPLPQAATEMFDWSWPRIEPFYRELAGRSLSSSTVADFLSDWTQLHDLMQEVDSRLHVAKDQNNADKEAEKRYLRLLDEVSPRVEEAEQVLRKKLLETRLVPAGMERPMRKIEAQAALFRDENVPLFVQESKSASEYDKLAGGQTVEWDGKEVTVAQMRVEYQSTDRSRREQAWRRAIGRQLLDRPTIDDLWQRALELRLKVAANAGYGDYLGFRWQQMERFDYTLADCREFHRAIEEAIVPLAAALYERRRKRLGLDRLRPWDLDVDELGRPALRPFERVAELEAGVARVIDQVAGYLGGYFRTMVEERLLDLENRPNKTPAGYCATFSAAKRPFIFMNAVGLHRDLMVLIHETGHACHSFEALKLPYFQQRSVGLEFAEVASMSLELLALPFLDRAKGGFYSVADAERAFQEHLEWAVLFWPYMAVVDAFQHWAYENPHEARTAANCDGQWAKLWKRFVPVVDWSGLDEELATGWQRRIHIHVEPLYYVEYGVALLGALQVWVNAQQDRSGAVQRYRQSLALGGTKSLPELYGAAGAEFGFDIRTLGPIADVVADRLGLDG